MMENVVVSSRVHSVFGGVSMENTFKVGQTVLMTHNKEHFEQESVENYCSQRYIRHFLKGKPATIIENDGTLLKFSAEDMDESNWFKIKFFSVIDTEIDKLQLEAQRI